MQNGHVFLSSALILLIPYLCLCLPICEYVNSTTRPTINSTDSGDVLNLTNILSGQEVFENGVSTSFTSGTKIATCTIKRKFLRRRLLYSPNGTESFNPVMLQIILSGDVHPQPGPNSKKKSKTISLDKIPTKTIQLRPRPWSTNMQIRASRLLI